MKKMIFLVVFGMIFPNIAKAQFKASIACGYGTYSMRDLKAVQESIRDGFPVQAKMTSSFPPYFHYEGGAYYISPNGFYTGLTLGYGSTGARSTYRDYSGALVNDLIVTYYSLQPSVGINKALREKLNIQLELRPGIFFTNLDVKGRQELDQEVFTEKYSFRGITLNVQPTIAVSRRLGNFGIKAFAGYHVSIYASKLTFSENDDAYLLTPDGEKAKPDWSGMRAGLGVEFYFGNQF